MTIDTTNPLPERLTVEKWGTLYEATVLGPNINGAEDIIYRGPRVIADALAHRYNTQPDLLAACRAQNLAIDGLFAMLIGITRARGYDGEAFLPSKSGEPWRAVELGNAALRDAEAL